VKPRPSKPERPAEPDHLASASRVERLSWWIAHDPDHVHVSPLQVIAEERTARRRASGFPVTIREALSTRPARKVVL
jgi:hypothetical protein